MLLCGAETLLSQHEASIGIVFVFVPKTISAICCGRSAQEERNVILTYDPPRGRPREHGTTERAKEEDRTNPNRVPLPVKEKRHMRACIQLGADAEETSVKRPACLSLSHTRPLVRGT